MKAIIFDASTLISLSMNGLFNEIREMKKIFKGHFIITREVKYEIIDKPITIKRFELEALRLKQLLEDKILEMPIAFGIDEEEISKRSKELVELANSTFQGRGRDIHLIDLGEASCLVLGKMLNQKKIQNVLAVDERTMRMLVEGPDKLKKLFQKKLHTDITSKPANYKFFKGVNIIRSSELVYVAYKKGLVKLKNGIVLDALLFYAVKFKGCSISDSEIKIIKAIK